MARNINSSQAPKRKDAKKVKQDVEKIRRQLSVLTITPNSASQRTITTKRLQVKWRGERWLLSAKCKQVVKAMLVYAYNQNFEVSLTKEQSKTQVRLRLPDLKRNISLDHRKRLRDCGLAMLRRQFPEDICEKFAKETLNFVTPPQGPANAEPGTSNDPNYQ